jgi:hypothetical protein
MCLMDSALIGPLVLVANLFFGIGFNEYTVLWFCFVSSELLVMYDLYLDVFIAISLCDIDSYCVDVP